MSPTDTPTGTAPSSSVRRVIVASLIGTSLEWYDFFTTAPPLPWSSTSSSFPASSRWWGPCWPSPRTPSGSLRDDGGQVVNPAGHSSAIRQGPLQHRAGGRRGWWAALAVRSGSTGWRPGSSVAMRSCGW